MDKFLSESEIKEIPLSSLIIDQAQVRTSDVALEIDELAESIKKIGLLEPIVVSPTDQEGKYEVLAGQRRFLAHEKIGAETIKAVVLANKVNEIEAKTISLTENMLRRELSSRDLINVCTFLYKRYGTIKDVVKETGLPQSKVSNYVKYDRLVPELKDMVDKEGLDIKAALRAQDAASVTGEVKVEDAVKFAKEMKTMSGAQQEKIKKSRQETPETPVEEVIEEAKTGKIIQVIVSLSPSVNTALDEFAKNESTKKDDAAGSLILEGLSKKGFIE